MGLEEQGGNRGHFKTEIFCGREVTNKKRDHVLEKMWLQSRVENKEQYV